MSDNKLRLGAKIKEAKKRRLTAMRKIAKNSVNFFKDDVFEAQGFIDQGVEKWKPRKKQRPGKTLVKTGRGRASIREKEVTSNKATIQAGAKYMSYHNNGTKNLPQRKFMGNSARLDKQNNRILNDEFGRIL